MTRVYLEVTYRKGEAQAAYLYLPRQEGDRSVRTEDAGEDLLVDYAADGRPIGIEIISPSPCILPDLSRLLERLGQHQVTPEDIAPLAAA